MSRPTDDRPTAIQTFELAKTFGEHTVVDGLDLSVATGELFALLGPNGAGKTTTIKMLCGLLRPSSGTAEIMGHDIRIDPIAMKRAIAVSPQETAIAEHLDAWVNLALMAGLHGLDRSETTARSAELLDVLALADRASERTKRYSGGRKRRLSIAMALVSDPEVLFLANPRSGSIRRPVARCGSTSPD